MNLRLRHEHSWTLSTPEAAAVQRELRRRVVVAPLPDTIRQVGGVDVSFPRGQGLARAAAVILALQTLEVIDQAVVEVRVSMPYIAGLLSFREAPAILAALQKLRALPDVLLVDGHGRAHPRRFGLACHLGVLLDHPVVGCAKSILVGAHAELGQRRGSTALLEHEGEVVGMALRTRAQVRPVYVSAGHRVDLPSAVDLVLACRGGYRLPEPTRQAHLLAVPRP